MKFSDIVGHTELKATLARAVDEGRISHAQLLSGDCGSGTLPLALAYAQYVNCTDRRDGDSCGVCHNCRKIGQLAHPGLHFVFPVNRQGKKSSEAILSDSFLPAWRETVAATGGYFDERMWYDRLDLGNLKGLISVKEADEIIRKLSFKSFEAEYKIMLVWLPEAMNSEAANRILKILEEPWERTLFLMVSQTPSRLLPTIVSRLQEVNVPGIDTASLAAWFAAQGTAEADRAARIARGSLLEARRIASGARDGAGGEEFAMFVSLMRFSYNDKHLELLEWAEEMAKWSREQQKRFLQHAVRLLRESYMLHAGMEGIGCLWGEERKFCVNFAPFIGNHNIEPLVMQMESALAQLDRNGNAGIIFAHFALTVSKLIVRNPPA